MLQPVNFPNALMATADQGDGAAAPQPRHPGRNIAVPVLPGGGHRAAAAAVPDFDDFDAAELDDAGPSNGQQAAVPTHRYNLRVRRDRRGNPNVDEEMAAVAEPAQPPPDLVMEHDGEDDDDDTEDSEEADVDDAHEAGPV